MLVLGTIFKSLNKSSSPEVYIHPASPPWGSSEEATTTVLGGFSKPKPATSGGKWLSNAVKTQPIVKSLVFCSQKMDNKMWNKFLKTDPLKLYETVSAEAVTLASKPSPTFPGFKITPPQFRLEFVPRVLKVQECQQCTSRHPGTKAWRGSERQL